MTGDHGTSFTQHNSKDVPQFAPNFTVYVLPPDVVCLYSEDRKFFLHGELYCALASAIGEGGKSFRELVRELEQDFPSDKIHEALKRLVDRRYVLPASRSSAGAAAAYWASLGLPPETAERNLQKCRVRIQSIDVQGATELGAALSELGVRVVKRSPDLTVTLVSDYLEGRLAELNRQHLSDRTPWLLVQPSGIFPLVGPVFSPGKSACWTCLADRMKRNREIKALLDRRQARCVAVSPLARHTFGQSGIQLAAVEIAKAIATDFRTDLRDHIISLDLLGSTIVKHYVAARPQCPSCGRKKLRDPRRAPVPIELGAGGKLVMTSGGYRTVSPRATVARFRKHVSPLTGVVSRLERIEADLPLNTNYYAAHNFSAPAKTVDELRAGLSGGSFGKGSTAEQGEASALMEAIERYSGIFQGDEIRVTRRFTDFPPGDAILPNDVLLFSDAQYRGTRRRRPTRIEAPTTPAPFDRSAEIEWSPVWSLRDERFKYLPTSLLYFFYRGPGAVPRGFQRLRGRQHARGSNRPGIPRAGGAGCLRDLVVQSIAAAGSGPRPVRRFLRPRSANPACRNRTPALGARRHQRSRDSELCGDIALDGERAGKHRVRIRRAFRCAHRLAARADRAQPISVHRSHGRRDRREIEPRRLHSIAPAGPSLSDAERQSGGPAGLRLEVRPSRHARAGDRLRAPRQARRASISSSSIRRAPTSRSRSSE